MTTDRQMHKELKGISSKHFPVWNETLGYERGLSHFREPPQFSEEGILVLTTGEYTCRRRMGVAPPMLGSSQLSPNPTGQVDLEDNSPQIAPPLSQNEYGIGDPSYLVPDPWQHTTWAPAQPPAAEPMTSLPEEHNAFLEALHYDQNPEHSTMEGGEEQAYPPSNFMPSMNTIPGSTTRTPMQLDHSEPMISLQPEAQTAYLSAFVPNSTPSNDTIIWH